MVCMLCLWWWLQIAETLKRFGVSDTTQNLLVARFDATPQDVSLAGPDS